VKLALENKQVSSSDPLQALEFSQIIDIIQKTIDEIHVICNNLRPTILDKLGLGKAIESLCRELGRITPSIRIHCTLDFETTDIPESLQLVIYRVIQEALNNAVKHSQATMIQVDLKSGSSSIDLEIADNGKGFSLKRSYGNITHPSQGLGLQSMQERAEMYGGCFAIFSEEHKGTMVRSAWPVKRH
jgi:two-component system NarL family sensor kinase